MSFSPTSYRLNNPDTALTSFYVHDTFEIFKKSKLPPHASHPDFGHLILLVFEAVLEVVFVALPGYIVARQGMFDADAQKFVANINVMIFTPCLVFTKLASQLTADKLIELIIIPFIFFVQILVSWFCAFLMSKVFRFKKRPSNFVTAMAVFGNSNSLPISLVLSLSQTISGLHWDAIPGDNDDEVAARGILYLLIFQQLGQLVRWTWGYNVLLKTREEYDEDEQPLLRNVEDQPGEGYAAINEPPQDGIIVTRPDESDRYFSGEQTPVNHVQYTDSYPPSPSSSRGSLHENTKANAQGKDRGKGLPSTDDRIVMDLHATKSTTTSGDHTFKSVLKSFKRRTSSSLASFWRKVTSSISKRCSAISKALPIPLQTFLSKTGYYIGRFARGVWAFMNPPLWAMLVAIVVASIPDLQRLFFTQGTFVNNSIVRAVSQSGGVAVPLILVVLGANLARNTLPKEDPYALEDSKDEKKLLLASLVARMLLPTLIMAPLLALTAKFVPVSILDDPIFVIVCFLLTGAPSALQLAQICQINNVYMGAMSKLLFQSYVVWILPSTLILVMCALEVVEWAQA